METKQQLIRIDYSYLKVSDQELASFITQAIQSQKLFYTTDHPGYKHLWRPRFLSSELVDHYYQGHQKDKLMGYFYNSLHSKVPISAYYQS